ncbi:hypothetical protein, partial [Vibrio parahaemolyticus]
NAEFDSLVETDFFAVSLPALIVFDSNLQMEHQQHCLFVKAMGQLGLALSTKNGSYETFENTLQALLMQSPAHTKANLFKEIAQHRYAFSRNDQM